MTPTAQALAETLAKLQSGREGDATLDACEYAAWAFLDEYGPALLAQLGGGREVVSVPRSNSLDPITVYLDDLEPGQGRMTIVCYNQAWTCYWGAMGNRSLRQFVSSCDASYVSGNMISGTGEVFDHERAYAVRVAQAVIDAIKAAPTEPAQAGRDGGGE